ncbi:uncharacterized protein LOC143234805 isoform X2 [Tachypleus tridentatus]|uniref:uncharacterized protein LOC143234805 isoform X2 n=1 Tax=Tachypleus tridentatus TaxID=6853 RepID=UPI003FD040E6
MQDHFFNVNNISISQNGMLLKEKHSIINKSLQNSTETQNFSRLSCEEIEDSKIVWNSAVVGTVVLAPCPVGYVGSAYRTCFANGQWGLSELYDCRFIKLFELKKLLDYHLVERLFDGLRQVMEELSIILKFQKIYSLLDRLDAICMISDIMKANVELVSNSYLDEEYIKVVLSSTDKLLTNQNSSISVNSDTQNL